MGVYVVLEFLRNFCVIYLFVILFVCLIVEKIKVRRSIIIWFWLVYKEVVGLRFEFLMLNIEVFFWCFLKIITTWENSGCMF